MQQTHILKKLMYVMFVAFNTYIYPPLTADYDYCVGCFSKRSELQGRK